MDKSKKEKCIVIGKTGSGKSFLVRKLVEKGLKPCLKWTTRPVRKFEKPGIDYNFVSDFQFVQSINENKFLAYQKFQVTPEGKSPENWYYGITQEEFDKKKTELLGL